MQAQANSFGWLAIRNVTYCLSSQPDPRTSLEGSSPSPPSSSPRTRTRLEPVISVVVLYHPENTNRAIAWCNTLVAFQDTEHVKCRVALPTCQRCDAVRNTSTKLFRVIGACSPGRCFSRVTGAACRRER